MSLLKLPFIASMTWGMQVTMSPPNPPPPLNEQVKPSGMEILAPWFPLAVKVGGHKTAQVSSFLTLIGRIPLDYV